MSTSLFGARKFIAWLLDRNTPDGAKFMNGMMNKYRLLHSEERGVTESENLSYESLRRHINPDFGKRPSGFCLITVSFLLFCLRIRVTSHSRLTVELIV